MIEFTGIKFSKVTKIFYKFVKGQLFKFTIFDKHGSYWAKSDYKDINGNSKNWVKASKDQIQTHGLSV